MTDKSEITNVGDETSDLGSVLDESIFEKQKQRIDEKHDEHTKDDREHLEQCLTGSNGEKNTENNVKETLRRSRRLMGLDPEPAKQTTGRPLPVREKRELSELATNVELLVEQVRDDVRSRVELKTLQEHLHKLDVEWEFYEAKYAQYAAAVDDTKELEYLGLQRQTLERHMKNCQDFVRSGSDRGEKTMSICSQSSSRRSSRSSRSRQVARTAKLAQLKLEQAEKQTQLEQLQQELKQRQFEAEQQQRLQTLRDEAELAQLEADLLAQEEEEIIREQDTGALKKNNGSTVNWAYNPYAPSFNPGDNRSRLIAPLVETPALAQETHFKHESDGDARVSENNRSRVFTSPVERSGFTQETHTHLMNDESNGHAQVNEGYIHENRTANNVNYTTDLVSTIAETMKQNAETTAVMKHLLQRQGVPKAEPPKFSGNADQFPIFKQRVEDWLNHKEFTGKERIRHLLSFVSGEALEAIQHCEIEENGYAEALTILKAQYGHPVMVVRASLNRVTEGLRIARGDRAAMVKLRNNLRACIKVLDTNEAYKHEMNASYNVEKVIDRLPLYLQINWAKRVPKLCAETKSGLGLNHVFQLVEEQVQIMSHPVFGAILGKGTRKENSNSTPLRGMTRQQSENRISTFATDVDPREAKCLSCNGKHLLTQCKEFLETTVDKRWKLVKEHKLCHLCLVAGHMKNECESVDACKCGAKYAHNKLLHRNLQTLPGESNNRRESGDIQSGRTTQQSHPPTSEQPDIRETDSHNPSQSQGERRNVDLRSTDIRKRTVLLHVVPVRVTSKDGQSLSTYGLLDNASTGTLIDTAFARKLGISGPTEAVGVTTVLGRQDCEFEVVSFFLQAAESKDADPVLEVEEGLVKDLNINERVLPHEITHHCTHI